MRYSVLFFLLPVWLLAQPAKIVSATFSNQIARVQWTGGEAPYRLEANGGDYGSNWVSMVTVTSLHAEVSSLQPAAAYRVQSLFASRAEYELTFDSVWSAATHPFEFPSFPHWSGLVGATHNASVSFWSPGALASPGVQQVAETGGKLQHLAEVNQAVLSGSAEQALSGPGIGVSPGVTTFRFTVSQDYPLLSLISMVAPSPDWFSGVHDLALFDPANGWLEPTITLFMYDAGTDAGTSYASANAPEPLRRPIVRLDDAHTQVNGSLQSVGTFRFRRL